MAINPSLGDKVNAGTSVAGAITLNHAQNIFTSDALISATKVFTVTSPLIDAFTIPYAVVIPGGSDTASYTISYGKVTPAQETLTNESAAVITPGTFVFTVNGTSVTTIPQIGVCFL